MTYVEFLKKTLDVAIQLADTESTFFTCSIIKRVARATSEWAHEGRALRYIDDFLSAHGTQVTYSGLLNRPYTPGFDSVAAEFQIYMLKRMLGEAKLSALTARGA